MSNIFALLIASLIASFLVYGVIWSLPRIARKVIVAYGTLLKLVWPVLVRHYVRKWKRLSARTEREMLLLDALLAHAERMTALSLLFCVVLLTGCATPSPPPALEIVEAPSLYIPPGLLTCPQEPVPPAAEGSTQRDVAVYIVDLSTAGQACRRRLNAVRELYEGDKADGVE